ncbi:hypothetical protein PG995_009709 [Apiospora arundinis]
MVIVDRTGMTAIYVGAGSKVRRLLGKSQYIALSVHEVDSVKQGFEPPPLCAEQPGCQSYARIYNNPPQLKDNFMLPNPKDVFASGPVGNTTDNMGGIEETCFAALVDLAFNQLDAEFDDVLAVCGLTIMHTQQAASSEAGGEAAQGKEEADKISKEAAEKQRKTIVEHLVLAALTILPVRQEWRNGDLAVRGLREHDDPGRGQQQHRGLAPFVIVGLLGARGFRTGKDFRNMAQKRHGQLLDTAVLGKCFKEQNDNMKERIDLTCIWT